MELDMNLATAANKKLVPTGHTMAGFEIQKDGSPLMTIGGKSTWPAIERQLKDTIKLVGDVHLVVLVRDKAGNITTTRTLFGPGGDGVVEK